MRKLTLLIVLGVVLMNAAPFNTVPAYTLPKGMGYVGPNLTLSIPTNTGVQLDYVGAKPPLTFSSILWAGYGIFPRFDMTLMVPATYDTIFSFNPIMLEARYGVIEQERFALSPVLDFFIPLPSKEPEDAGDLEHAVATFGIGPGVMASGQLGRLLLHGNLFSYFILPRPSKDIPFIFNDVIVYLALEYPTSDNFSLYLETNVYGLFGSLNSEFLLPPVVEIWPGVSWTPLDWLSVNAACGVPLGFDYITPGIAAYVSF